MFQHPQEFRKHFQKYKPDMNLDELKMCHFQTNNGRKLLITDKNNFIKIRH